MEAVSKLQYQSVIYAAGSVFNIVESYDSLFERLRAAGFKVDDDRMGWTEPLELTVSDSEQRPLRMAIQPHTISAIVEIPEGDRREVREG